MSFRPDLLANAGRFIMFNMGKYQVLLDYGHNLSGYHCVTQFVIQLDYSRLVGIVGMPGDRQNRAIYEVGQLCGKTFDRLYIKEDKDLGGRDTGEVGDLICRGAISGGHISAFVQAYLGIYWGRIAGILLFKGRK